MQALIKPGASATQEPAEAPAPTPAASSPSAYHGGGPEAIGDVRALQQKLHATFAAETAQAQAEPDQTAPAPQPAKPAKPRKWPLGRTLKLLAALVLFLEFGWRPVQALMTARSVEAVANARLTTLRAPIEGEVALADGVGLRRGAGLSATLAIEDKLADRGRLDDLQRQLADLDAERRGLEVERDGVIETLADVRRRGELFMSYRRRQVEARRDAAVADLRAARDEREALKSVRGAARAGLRAARDRIGQAIGDARGRLAEFDAELDAANVGLVADSGAEDSSRADQASRDLGLKLSEIEARLQVSGSRVERLRTDIAAERTRYDDRAHAKLTTAAGQRVWEVLVANGEHVSRGQDLMRVLDCSSAVVTAEVDERVYNQLKLGSRAAFSAAGAQQPTPGVVINLTGASAAPGDLAISPEVFRKEPYHVTIEAPGLAADEDCPVGRTGVVTFDTGGEFSFAGLRSYLPSFGL